MDNSVITEMKEIANSIAFKQTDLSEKKAQKIANDCVDAFYQYRKRLISKKQPNNDKWTYIMYNAADDLFKIGISNNPYARLHSMITALPKLHIVMLHVDNIEKELHERYKDKWFAGEWYRLTEEDLVDLLDDGFRFSPDSFRDDFNKNELYCVQREELKKKNNEKIYFARHKSYWDLINLHKELGERCKKDTVKEANKRGMRTPSGFAWTYSFALVVFKLYEQYLNGEID